MVTKCMRQPWIHLLGCFILISFLLIIHFKSVTFSDLNHDEYTPKNELHTVNVSEYESKSRSTVIDDTQSRRNASEFEYISKMIEWSDKPNSFCFENRFALRQGRDSSIIILSISNLKEWRRNLKVTKKFIFYIRISRILYANKFGYRYCEFQETFDISKPPHWSKWNAIRILSTLNDIEHIVWMDIDAIFHSKTPSIENSAFYQRNLNSNKLFVFTQSGSNHGINAGIFMTNTKVRIEDGSGKTWSFLDVLDLFSYIETSKEIKTYIPPYEQWVLRVFVNQYKAEYNRLCALLGSGERMQLFGPNKLDYNYFIWHWTGKSKNIENMVSVIENEIDSFLNQAVFIETHLYIMKSIQQYIMKNDLNALIESGHEHVFEPDWIKQSLICESTWWNKQKTVEILGKVYDAAERKSLCQQNE